MIQLAWYNATQRYINSLQNVRPVQIESICRQQSKCDLKGGPSDLGNKILQKYLKIILIIPKPFNFHS